MSTLVYTLNSVYEIDRERGRFRRVWGRSAPTTYIEADGKWHDGVATRVSLGNGRHLYVLCREGTAHATCTSEVLAEAEWLTPTSRPEAVASPSTTSSQRSRRGSMPERIQRKRTKGWRMPEGAVYVGRPSRWGNPYVVGAVLWDQGVYQTNGEVRDAQHAVDLYRRWLVGRTGGLRTGYGPIASAFLTMGDPRELRGHDLACWCALDQPCHADVLLEVANG